jgi:hypothetical protein
MLPQVGLLYEPLMIHEYGTLIGRGKQKSPEKNLH